MEPRAGAREHPASGVTGPTGRDRGRSRRCATSRASRVSPRARCRASSTMLRPGSRSRPTHVNASSSPPGDSATGRTRMPGACGARRRCSSARSCATSAIRSSRPRSRRWRSRRWRAATTSSSATPTAASTRGSPSRRCSRPATPTPSSCSATCRTSRASSTTCAIHRCRSSPPGRARVRSNSRPSTSTSGPASSRDSSI